jgi:membrane protease YdiL (CAAX protease family)
VPVPDACILNAMQKNNKWVLVFIMSMLIVIWRVADFVYEALDGDVHIYRMGLALKGKDAIAMELIVILSGVALVWLVIQGVHWKSYRPGWAVLLVFSAIMLIWRLVDFTYEAVAGSFYFTRAGMELGGINAALMELLIIIVVSALAIMAARKLAG